MWSDTAALTHHGILTNHKGRNALGRISMVRHLNIAMPHRHHYAVGEEC